MKLITRNNSFIVEQVIYNALKQERKVNINEYDLISDITSGSIVGVLLSDMNCDMKILTIGLILIHFDGIKFIDVGVSYTCLVMLVQGEEKRILSHSKITNNFYYYE